MNIEQKMVLIRRALELGACVDLNLHNCKEESEAKQVAEELSQLTTIPHKAQSHGGTQWFKIDDRDNHIGVVIFYDDDEGNFMEEDVDLSGMEEENHAV